MSISVKTAHAVGWAAISLAPVISIGLMMGIALFGQENNWPMYISVPLALVLPITAMITCFHFIAIRWCKWAYMNVSDVHELDAASRITGLAYYPPATLEKKHPEAYAAIMQRYADYVFIDDDTLKQETIVLNKRPWQSLPFILLFLFSSFIFTLASPLFVADERPTSFLLVLGSIPLLLAIRKAYILSNRTPQIICNNDFLIIQEKTIPWHEIEHFEIIQGKQSTLNYTVNGENHSMRIEDLSPGFADLNHLLFIYSRRHRRDNSALYRRR